MATGSRCREVPVGDVLNREKFLNLLELAAQRSRAGDGPVWLCELRDVLSDAGFARPRMVLERAWRAGWITLEPCELLASSADRTLLECSETRIDGVVYHLARRA